MRRTTALVCWLPGLCGLPQILEFSQARAAEVTKPAVVASVAASTVKASRPGAPAVRRVATSNANFFVEWRRQARAASPALVIGTATPTPPGWITVRSDPQASPTGVRVANGHEAVLHLDRAQNRRTYDFVWTAQGQSVVSHDEVLHEVQALRVTPHGSGAGSPVLLEVTILQESAPASAELATTDGQDGRHVEFHSTLQVPLDEWVTVGRLAEGAEEVQIRLRRL